MGAWEQGAEARRNWCGRRKLATLVTRRWWTIHRWFRELITLSTILAYVTTATAGPVIMSGDDFAQHGSKNAQGVPQEGWFYIQKALQNLQANVTRPGNNGRIAVLGSTPSTVASGNAGAAIGAAADAANIPVDYYFDASDLTRENDLSDFFEKLESGAINPAIIWLAGSDDQVANDLNPSESAVLTANAQKLADFVNSGGGLMAHGHGPVAYGWLTTLMPGLQEISAENENFCQSEGASLTAAGQLAFPGLSDSDIGGVDKACHGHFEGSIGALQVLAYDGFRSTQFPQGRMFIIGGGNTIITGQISLAPLAATRPLDTMHTVTASVTAKTAPFSPLANVAVTFRVESGPNIGKTAVVTTAANGQASFTYTGDHGVGTDQIRASFLDGTTTRLSNLVTVGWNVLCDTNNDNMVDTTDINTIFAAIGSTVSAGDLRDAVVDGLLTVNDARACVLRCPKPQCADNAVPVANAGPDQEVTLGPPVILDGSGSADPNPVDTLSFSWGFAERPVGSTATLVDPTVAQPQFTPDLPGTYILQLIVNDGAVNSAPDTVQIMAVPPIVAVPNVVQMTQAEAQQVIETAGLRLGTITLDSSETVAAGSVLSQNPTGGTNAPGGSPVSLVVSSGRPPVTVPDVTGLPQAAAQAELTAAGLTMGEITLASSTTIPASYVISQHPHEGESVPGGTAVDLVISSGGPQVTVPDVRGQTQQAAQSTIEAASLLLGSVTQASSATVPAGKVITQTPAAGSSVPTGSVVSLVVSLGTLPGGDLSRPTVQLTVMPPATAVGDTVTLAVSATDGEGVTSTTLRINGTVVPLDAGGHATFSSATPGIFSAVATAWDAASNEGRAETEFRFQTTGDSTQPTVSITAPADGAELTLPTTITGSVSDDGTLVRYLVQASRAGKNEFFTVASGAGPVTNGMLGTFDPTLLVNGAYELRVSVEDASGNVTTVTRSVEVDGQAKVGNFSLSFDDLTIPVAGIPITITRTYDSRNKSQGDFGVGWTLAVKDLEVLESGILGSQWEQQADTSGVFPKYTLQPKKPRFVTVRFPDGRLHTFTMKVTPSTQNLIPIDFPTASFTPAAGTTATLVSLDPNNLIVNPPQPGNVTLLSSNFATYDPTRYKLTDKEGMVYVINQETGLEKITDLNGNTITFTANGILHSAGPSVTFTRDAENRITKITDPMGHTIEYAYDFYGDLVAVTDQEDYTTQFLYNNDHGLLDIVDPRGIKVARNEYDDNGRLVALVDAEGKRTELTHDLPARREEVRDRLENVTSHEYDARGNITAIIDTLGNRTTFTYDSRDNQLTETTPLGHTTTFTYDSQDNLLTKTDPLGGTETFTYNVRGQVLTHTDARGKVTTNTYDAKGNRTSTTDATGKTTSYAYDPQGNLLTQTDALGHSMQLQYDSRGNLTRGIDLLGHATTYTYNTNGKRLTATTSRTTLAGVETLSTAFTYDNVGRLLLTTTPDGATTRLAYDALGKKITETDQLNRLTRYTYDAVGRLTQTTFPDGTTEEHVYDAEGRPLTTTDRAGQDTNFQYNALGSLTQTTFSDGAVMTFSYDAANRLTTQTDSRGKTTHFAYDAAGRRTAITDALRQETTFIYDAAGNQSVSTDPSNHITTYVYDALNRLTHTEFPDGTERRTAYDAVGRRITETDQAGQTTQFAYDALGRLTSVTDAVGQVTRYTYDEVGNRLTQTDANNHTSRFDYDQLGRLTRRTLPDGAVEALTYDSAGNLITRTDFAGRATAYVYDVNNHLTRRTYPDGSMVAFTYTPTGQRTTVTDSRGITTYAYDGQYRLQSVQYPNGQSLSYAYDERGNRTSLTATIGASQLTTSYAYDALNRLQSVTDPESQVYTYTYDSNGNRTFLAYPNGVATTSTYNAVNHLTSLISTHSSSGQTIQSYSYTLGPTGNRTQSSEQGGIARAYTYDALSRLTHERITNGGVVDYETDFTYDAVGNRTVQATTGNGAGAAAYTYDERDRLLLANASAYTWDAQGNLVSSSGGATYTWDVENRLTRIETAGGPVISYTYDADGNRVQTTVTPPTGTPLVTNSLVDTSEALSHVVAESDSNGTVQASYVRGDDELLAVIRPAATRFYHADGLGSIRRLTDEAGNLTDVYTYTASGELLSHVGSDPQPYAFAGEPHDPYSGLSYNRARWLDPQVGRFVSMDAFAGHPEEPLSLHKYLYATADPVNKTDPTGLFTLAEQMEVISTGTVLVGITLLALAQSRSKGRTDSVASEIVDRKQRKPASMRVQVQRDDIHIDAETMIGSDPPGIPVSQFKTALGILYNRAVGKLKAYKKVSTNEARVGFWGAVVETISWAEQTRAGGGIVTTGGRVNVYRALFPNRLDGPYRFDTENLRGHNLRIP